jgi:hypothetical protein
MSASEDRSSTRRDLVCLYRRSDREGKNDYIDRHGVCASAGEPVEFFLTLYFAPIACVASIGRLNALQQHTGKSPAGGCSPMILVLSWSGGRDCRREFAGDRSAFEEWEYLFLAGDRTI